MISRMHSGSIVKSAEEQIKIKYELYGATRMGDIRTSEVVAS